MDSHTQRNGKESITGQPHSSMKALAEASHATHEQMMKNPIQGTPPKLTKSCNIRCSNCANDPSAGSPTETLLRLLLPLSDKVH